jgi:phenylalanyl-tRNA synthetase beta chain
MAIVTMNRKIFEREIGKLDDKMLNKIAMFGTTVESLNEKEIEIEVFPNRPDLLSYHGFKRSFLIFLGKASEKTSYNANKPEPNYRVNVDSSVKKIRPCIVCAIIKKLTLDDEKIKEIIEIQEKLHTTIGRKRKKIAIGIYPLEKIQLPITYKAIEPDKIKFIPLETTKEMSGLQILQRHPAGRKYAHLLAGKIKFPIFMDANKNILSMPPIINSHLTGKITEKTKDIFVECSGFDLDVLNKCLNIIVATFADMGGNIYQMEIRSPKKEITPDLKYEKMKLSLENTNKLLGLNLNEKQLKKLIEKMGHIYKKSYIEIAPWRIDILHEVDLIEDVAIAYGYDNFVPEIPEISTIGQEDPSETTKRKISEILSGLNMIEISNYHLTNQSDQFKKMGFKAKDFVEVEESKTDYKILRENLAHYLLKILSENVDAEYSQKIFEIGKVFDNELNESEHLAVAITPGNFTELRQIVEYLSTMIDQNIKLGEPTDTPSYFIEGRVAEIKLDNKSLGFIGEIHPRILKNWKIKMPVTLFEIDLDEILKKLT